MRLPRLVDYRAGQGPTVDATSGPQAAPRLVTLYRFVAADLQARPGREVVGEPSRAGFPTPPEFGGVLVETESRHVRLSPRHAPRRRRCSYPGGGASGERRGSGAESPRG